MKRVTLNVTPMFLVPDDADVDTAELQEAFNQAVRNLPYYETTVFRRSDVVEVRTGTCKVGPHEFAPPDYWRDDRPIPDLCPRHAYAAAMQDASDEHAPFFAEVERLTGLKGHIWQSGGMTMTIVVPVQEPVFRMMKKRAYPDQGEVFWRVEGGGFFTDREHSTAFSKPESGFPGHPLAEGTEWYEDEGPVYMGLRESYAEDGDDENTPWAGSLSFYPDGYDDTERSEDLYIEYDDDKVKSPKQWAALLAEHYNTWKENRA